MLCFLPASGKMNLTAAAHAPRFGPVPPHCHTSHVELPQVGGPGAARAVAAGAAQWPATRMPACISRSRFSHEINAFYLIEMAQVVGPERPGRRILVLGDSPQPRAPTAAAGCQLVIAPASYKV